METITNTLGSIKNTVTSAFTTTSPPEVTRSAVLGLEETERTRRIEQVSQTRVDKQNAANISSLIRTQSFPVFKGNVSKGYKRVTIKFEEEERRRRLTNKSESALRRTNANKTARMIQHLGWPLYRSSAGPEYIVMDPTKLLEEEEREWRTHESYWAPTAKHNAAMVANILRWGSFQRNPRAGFKRHVRFLEEKERKDRIRPEVMKSSMENAYNESGLIRHMGPPFYTQSALGKRDFSQINQLEEQERKRRIENPEERQLARELAGVVGGHLNKESELEEQERGRRILDIKAQKLAKENAKHVSLMVRESSSNKIAGTGPMWFSISRNSMKALEEIERTRRLRDIEGQRLAKQHAKQVSDIIVQRWSAPPKRSLNAIEEEERQSRILDRAQQHLAMKNARKVSGLVARHLLMSSGSKSYALALEESERSRRLQDNEQQTLAKNNAKKVSNLVSSLSLAPGHHVEGTREAPAAALPEFHAPIAKATTVNIPVTPVSAAPIAPITPVAAPIAPITPVVAAPIAPITPVVAAPIAPITPVVAAPIAPITPVVAAPIAPVASAPLQKAPVASAPLQKELPTTLPAGLQRSSGEFKRSESPLVAAAPIPRSAPRPSSAPLASSPTIQPLVLPTTSAPVPVAPLASTGIPRQPSLNSIPTTISAPSAVSPSYISPVTVIPAVPVDNIAVQHPNLGEKERKKLLKQADKHNKKSEKDVRKAEQSMLKAEKFHQKGRDDKAMKLENKAEQLMKAAEHERRWANGIQNELTSTGSSSM